MQTDLIKQISATIGKPKVLELSRILSEQNADLKELVELTLHPDQGISFRAAWLLENTLLHKPEQFLPVIPYVISCIKQVQNPSAKRHYAKIIMHLTSAKAHLAVKQVVYTINLEPVIELCFDWVINPTILIAVKVHACESLFNISTRYPWIKDELGAQLEYLMRDGTAAIQTRGRRLLAGLKKKQIELNN